MEEKSGTKSILSILTNKSILKMIGVENGDIMSYAEGLLDNGCTQVYQNIVSATCEQADNWIVSIARLTAPTIKELFLLTEEILTREPKLLNADNPESD